MSAASTAQPDDFAPLIGCQPSSPDSIHDADASLMVEVRNGSESAFTLLVSRHQGALVNFFSRMGASSDADDLVQETFLRLFRYRRRYRPAARFTTFLYHLARNVWADRGRKIIRNERIAAELQSDADSEASTSHPSPGDVADVEAALNRLSPKLREVIVLNIYQGLRYQEVADVLHIPLGTVKSRINLAIAALKEILDER